MTPEDLNEILNNPRSPKRYNILSIDPPWPKRKGGLRKTRPQQDRNLNYPTMEVSEIFKLLDQKIFILLSRPHTVFLWNIDQFLHEGEQQMLKRGYKLHARLIWDKKNGVAPAFSIRYSHEYVSWFYKPIFMPVDKDSRGKLRSVLQEPAREHSRKPNVFYQAVEMWYPETNRLDVFSRETRDGWDH